MTPKLLMVVTACMLFTGCWLSNREIPVPQNELQFAAPVQKPLKLGPARKVKWTTDTLRQGHTVPLDLDKLPGKVFHGTGFEKISTPPKETVFNLEAIPDTAIDLDQVPWDTLIWKTAQIGALKKVTLGAPRIRYESPMTSFQYTAEQGLSSSQVQCTLNTTDGLLWIGTSAGLCILKGSSLEILPSTYGTILFLREDSIGQVWLRSQQFGIFVIDRKKGIQRSLSLNLRGGADIRFDKKGIAWIPTFENGLYQINPKLDKIRHFPSNTGFINGYIQRTFEDVSGNTWITTAENGIYVIDKTLKRKKHLGPKEGFNSDVYLSMVESNSGDLYISNYGKGVDVISPQRHTVRHIDSLQGIANTIAYNIFRDAEDRIWIGTGSKGIYILKNDCDSIAHLGSSEGVDDVVWFLSGDTAGHVIVSTNSNGLNVFPKENEVAHHFSIRDGLLDDEVWGLLSDPKNRLWIGTHKGINILTPDNRLLNLLPEEAGKSNRFQKIIYVDGGKYILTGNGGGLFIVDDSSKTITQFGQKDGLPSTAVVDAFVAPDGKIWLSTFDNGVTVLDPKKRTVSTLNQNGGLVNNRVFAVVRDNNSKYWITTFTGVEILDPTTDSLRNYSFNYGLSNDQVTTMLRDRKDRIWIGTERGLNMIDSTRETNTIFGTSNGIPGNGIYSLYEKDNHLLVGSGKGLAVVSEKNNRWHVLNYGKSQGFNFLDFNGNTVDYHNGDFWWGIIQGVTKFNFNTLLSATQVPAPTVSGIDLMGKAQYFVDPSNIDHTDTIWSETRDTFYLKGSFAGMNTDKAIGIEWDSLSETNFPVSLSLPHDRNYMRFHFDSYLPQYEGTYQYMYILDGVDEKWSSVTEQPFSDNYNNVSPGYYTFRVVAKKGNGPWSEASVYHFKIRPPWWLSWWAELIYLLAFIGLIRLWVSYRSRKLIIENANLEKKVEERTAELSASLENLRQTQGQLIQSEKMASLGELTAGIAHEIQNPLNFVNNFSEVNTELLEDVNKALEKEDIPEAKDLLKDVGMNMGKITFHGKRADAIVKGMLLHSRASSGQKIPTDVNALADEYLRLSYHGLRAKDKTFNANFNMDFDQSLGPVMLVQQDIGRVLLNMFNNAFYSVTEKKKLSPDGFQPMVTVSTKKKGNTVEIKIRDNGTGIPQKVIDKIYQPFFTTKPAGQGTGLGLSLSYDIVTKEHNGKIDVVTSENEFTEFIILLPALSAA